MCDALLHQLALLKITPGATVDQLCALRLALLDLDEEKQKPPAPLHQVGAVLLLG